MPGYSWGVSLCRVRSDFAFRDESRSVYHVFQLQYKRILLWVNLERPSTTMYLTVYLVYTCFHLEALVCWALAFWFGVVSDLCWKLCIFISVWQMIFPAVYDSKRWFKTSFEESNRLAGLSKVFFSADTDRMPKQQRQAQASGAPRTTLRHLCRFHLNQTPFYSLQRISGPIFKN